MRCPSCSAANPEGMNFCGACGQALVQVCPRCQAKVPPEFNFCGQCGSALRPQPLSPLADDSETIELESLRDRDQAERRQLTVMFCDLVGSTELAEELDPEEFRDLVRAYQQAAGREVQRFEGHVAQYLGDGILVYFGYPVAHEDNALRAVHAGLRIVEAVGQLRARPDLADKSLAVRIGLHTGQVVAGSVGWGQSQEQLALGPTPNVAARLQALAKPGQVVLSADTHDLVEGHIVCESLGERTLRGVSRPMEIFRALHRRETSLGYVRTREMPPLVDRKQELSLLLERFRRVREGRGQAILLSAEPGIGKSRLVEALHESLASEPHSWLISRCWPYHQDSAFFPLIDLLQRYFRFEREDSPNGRLRKIEIGLGALDGIADDAVPLFADLLSIPAGSAYPMPDLSSQKKKERTVGLIIEALALQAREAPLVFVVEDLQWVDPSTQEFIETLLRHQQRLPVLTVLTCRPAESGPWALPPLTQILLDRLTEDEVTEVVSGITGGRQLPEGILEQLVEKTDGVPLFAEELTKTILQSGMLTDRGTSYEVAGEVSSSISIPTSLKDSLTARLDHLATIKDVIQMSAVLGREFSFDVLLGVSEQTAESLLRDLDLLVEGELLHRRGTPPEATYVFRHALIRDAAYEMLLKSTRQRYHRRVAEVLIERCPDQVETQPELVAQHYSLAGDAEPAARYWLLAGQRAQGRSANTESRQHLEKGLTLVATLPESPQRDALEASFRVALGTVLITLLGFTAPAVEEAYVRARELYARTGDDAGLFWVLLGLKKIRLVHGEIPPALELCQSLIDLAQALDDSNLLAAAQEALAEANFFMGELETSLGWFEKNLVLASPDDSFHRSRTGTDLRVNVNCLMSLICYMLGDPRRAERHAEEGIALARQSSYAHAFTLAVALVFAGLELRYFRREPAALLRHAEELRRLTEERGIVLWNLHCRIFSAWAEIEVMVGDGTATSETVGAAVASLETAMRELEATGSRLSSPHFSGLFAEALMRQGRLDDARRVLDGALAAAERNTDRFGLPELWRLAGELERLRDDPGQAEAAFEKAVAEAARQKARSLELRAAIPLAELWLARGEKDRARELLSRIREGFADGVELPEIARADQRLAELTKTT